jgi:hypothetical protein
VEAIATGQIAVTNTIVNGIIHGNAINVLSQSNVTKETISMYKDPVFFDVRDNKWYFYDETWSNVYGPYDTEEAARIACNSYAMSL